MSQFGDFIENVYKINESSAKYASNLQRVNEEVISKVNNVGINSIKPLFEFVSKLKLQMIDILPFSYSTNLIPLLRPIFDAFSSELENEIVSNLESFRLSVFWRFKPLTDIIDNIVGGLREESRRIIINRRRLPTYSIQPKVYPITSKEKHEISDSIGPTPQLEYLPTSRTPQITIRRSVDYRGYGISRKVTSEVETEDRIFSKISPDIPVISLSPNFVRVRGNVASVSKKGMAKLSSGTLSELYTRRVSDWSRASSDTLSQMSNIGKFYFSIPAIKRGLQLLSVGGVGSFITELPFVSASSLRHAEEHLTESSIFGPPPRIFSRLYYGPHNLPSHVLAVKSSLSDSVFSHRLLEIETMFKEVLRHLFRVYSSRPPIPRLSTITETSKVERDHFRGEFARSSSSYPETSIAALTAIAPSASRVYSRLVKSILRPQLTGIGSYPQTITEKVAESSIFRTHLPPVFKALSEIVTRQDYRTPATRGVPLSTGFKMDKLTGEEYSELGKRFDAIPESIRTIPLTLYRYKQLLFTTRSFLQPSKGKIAEAVSYQQPIKLNMSVLDAFYKISKVIQDRETGVQKTLQLSVDGAVSDMMVVERNVMERFPSDALVTVPTVKLQEIVSTISSVQTPSEREMPARIMRDRLTRSGSSRSIEVTVDSLRDERDVRELERKLARILREEARRYGLI